MSPPVAALAAGCCCQQVLNHCEKQWNGGIMGAIKIAIKITNMPTYQTLQLMKGDWQIGETST